MKMTDKLFIIKIYLKGKRLCFAEVECSEEIAANFDRQLDDDAITMLRLGKLRIPRSMIHHVIVKEK